MTINITAEELKSYQSAVKLWAVKRAEFLAQQVFVDNSRMTIMPKEATAEAIKQWEAANPFPALLPQI